MTIRRRKVEGGLFFYSRSSGSGSVYVTPIITTRRRRREGKHLLGSCKKREKDDLIQRQSFESKRNVVQSLTTISPSLSLYYIMMTMIIMIGAWPPHTRNFSSSTAIIISTREEVEK